MQFAGVRPRRGVLAELRPPSRLFPSGIQGTVDNTVPAWVNVAFVVALAVAVIAALGRLADTVRSRLPGSGTGRHRASRPSPGVLSGASPRRVV